MDELDGAHIHASRWLRRDQQVDIAVKLSGDHDFLLITSGKLAGEVVSRGSSNVEALNQFASNLLASGKVDIQPLGEYRLVGGIEHQVFSNGEL